MLLADEIKLKIDAFAKRKQPFVVVLNFLASHGYFFSIDELEEQQLQLKFPSYATPAKPQEGIVEWKAYPQGPELYKSSFDKVQEHLHYGNSFLTNLTCSTPIDCNLDLNGIFNVAEAKYKLAFKNNWVCFSPETFVQIKNGQLFSFPMKGTIDSSLPDARTMILNDPKELAEHYTIVDLIRNDMSMVANHVRVEEFRYIDCIHSREKQLLQVSSRIAADLNDDYRNHLSEIIFTMLPAGSISGAPKQKTVSIIQEAETHDRGFYTGTAYYFDGQDLDSCVLIRFIENTKNGLVYKSGGGITIHSAVEKEYQEMVDKIYIPTSNHASSI